MNIFTEIFFRPLFNAVIYLYNIIPGSDFGVAIIVLTLLVRFVLLPLSIKSVRSQKALNEINPLIKEIKEKHKKDMSAQSAEIMKLYKEKGINPLSGCLPLIIQLPILFALYKVFTDSFKPESLSMLYSFVANPEVINKTAFGFLDLSVSSPVLVIVAGIAQFLQMKVSVTSSNSGNKELDAMNKQMLYFFPIMIIIIGWNLPAGLLVYWIATTVISLGEQFYIKKSR